MKRTHYDNLQVARTASPEVIKAAYRSLSTKYHPDRNLGDEKCARIMTIINEAYAVLSDPVRRKQHDEWIEATKTAAPRPSPSAHRPQADPVVQRPAPPMHSHWQPRSSRSDVDDLLAVSGRAKVWVLAALMILVAMFAYFSRSIEIRSTAEQTEAEWEFH